MPGTYREIIRIPSKTSAPPITIYGTDPDAKKTVIVKGNSAGGSPEGDMIAKGTSASATFTMLAQHGFQAKNLTIANDYVEGTIAGTDQEAVALLNQGDRAQYENVRILGNSYTLYVKSVSTNEIARSYFRDSYIEGDATIIAGRGTAVFDHCEIHSIGGRVTGGEIAAASTELTNPHGLLFISSKFTADAGTTGVFFGRQWFEGMRQEAVGKIIIRNSTLGEHFNKAAPWTMTSGRVTPKEAMATTPIFSSDHYFPAGQAWTPKELFLAEYGNTGPGATP
jgi:pectinesterase